ncbi:sporulation protein [Jeotgalibacillus haloalkalitolerans]|uniref:Sporulation protein n=1 Tax=Jeotgalibacillus haloalkalitolerans TaxID=3104292 RepID=A0ABU5KP05_9BACL|nr:sporulation protein [Jeotgalibacillus sp. HH7-29]MDZ5712987.1 sporulation protein [Jeotgalibacillus sp. HH7-29]
MKKTILLMICSFVLFGCATIERTGPVHVKIHDSENGTIKEVAQHIEDTKELYDSVVVAADSTLVVSYKVKHLHRFQMKEIEKKMKAWLEEKYPDKEIVLSSDYKIFLELYDLSDQWASDSLSEKEAMEEIEKIIKLKKEMT